MIDPALAVSPDAARVVAAGVLEMGELLLDRGPDRHHNADCHADCHVVARSAG